MNRGMSTSARLGAALAVVAALGGCGGDSPTTRPPVVIVTPEPVRAILAQTSFANFYSEVWVSLELIVTQRGVLDITVDWTFPDTWMYVYLSKVNCSYQQLSSNACPFLLSSETQKPKPRVLYTGSLEPGTYYLVLYNVGLNVGPGIGSQNVESVALQLGLTVFPGGASVPGGVTIGRTQLLTPGQ
jgi:hypothetical protein